MNNSKRRIDFYRAGGTYGCFSNFSLHPVFLKGKSWTTSEHYFQAQKFAGTQYEEEIRQLKTPGDAARRGRERSLPLRKDWEQIKDEVMYDVVFAKFTQNDGIGNILRSTGDCKLVEHTTNDSYWGDGGDGTGRNQLGITLMKVREDINRNGKGNNKVDSAEVCSDKSSVISENISDGISETNGTVDSEETDQSDDIDIEPNNNRDIEVDVNTVLLSKPKKAPEKQKRARYSKKRQVLQDADGSATFEKTNDNHGKVTIVGEGTVVSEKVLPPQAKFVVHRHQMRRKYQPNEKDFEEDEEDESNAHVHEQESSPTKYSLSDFIKNGTQHLPNKESKEPKESIHSVIEQAKSYTEFLKTLAADFPDRVSIVAGCKEVQSTISRYIEELTEILMIVIALN